jgi:glycosyltransferase involved in cell wall biosynthesis
MKHVLILCAHRPKRSPSQRYRFEQYLPYLQENGFSFTFSYLLNQKDDVIFYSSGNTIKKAFILLKGIFIRIKDIFRFKKFDIVFIQREACFFGTSYFEKKAFKSGARVIFDFDDSIWLSDTSPGNKKWEWLKNANKFYANIKYAHTVIAGNSYLKQKAQTINKNTILIPTTINTDVHIAKPQLRNNDVVVIGWSGSISTIKHFETLLPVLIELKEKHKHSIAFKILGQTNYTTSLLEIESIAWSEENEVDVLNTFDIGIMPLINDEWTNGKCGLKGLSYMACEVATVMSNVGVNNQIITTGVNGFLVNNDKEWYSILDNLITNTELRKKMGIAGRETVLKNYSVNANKHVYLETFKNNSTKL